jgi:hypothetical protein
VVALTLNIILNRKLSSILPRQRERILTKYKSKSRKSKRKELKRKGTAEAQQTIGKQRNKCDEKSERLEDRSVSRLKKITETWAGKMSPTKESHR